MPSRCAWCNKVLPSSPIPDSESKLSHGICEDCQLELEYKKVPFESILDLFSFPVLVSDGNAVILNANQKAVELVNKEIMNVRGLIGGDVIECVYADLPGGCGETEQCTACTLRNSIETTYESGNSIKDQQGLLYIKSQDGVQQIPFVFNTEKVGEKVYLQLRSISPE